MLRISDAGYRGWSDATTQLRAPGRRRDRTYIVATLLLTMAMGVLPTPSPAAAPVTEAIAVDGNRRIDTETIRSYFHPAPDGRLDAAAIDNALKALIATGQFDNVSIDRTAAGLVVHLSEAKILGRVAFEGNSKIKDADLEKLVQSKVRSGLQRATVQADAGRIAEAYRRIGRQDVAIVPEVIDRGNDRADLVFTVTEGKKSTVRDITFVGNHAFADRQLKAVIKTSQTSVLSFLTGGDVYDPDRIDGDREQLRHYYLNHGYADASVAQPVAAYDPSTRSFALTFPIDEGPLYRFGDIRMTSDVSGLSPEKLRPSLLVRDGALFDASALDKSTAALAVAMAKLGYPFARAEPHMIRHAEARRVDIDFVIDQGRRTYVERIEIHGNSRTRDDVIRREFDLGEGDAYNGALVDRAERRLKALNYFKTVRITTKPGSSPDRVVLDVEAIDQPTGDFAYSGGYSTTDGLLGEIKVGERNFYGTGRTVQAAVSYGQFARSVDLTASEPYFLGTRTAAGIQLFGRQSLTSPNASYGSQSYGANFTLGTPITERTSVQWRYSLYDQTVTLGPGVTAATVSLPIRQAAAAGPQLVSSMGSTVTHTTLNDPKSPSDGIHAQLRQDLAGLGGDVKFLRTTADVRYYRSINSDLVAMVRAQGGNVTGLGGRQVPLLNSFFGGPTMVRGFAVNGFGPRDLTAGSTMDNVGGSMFWATTAELQSAIPGVPEEYGLKASAFIDAGSVFRYNGPTQSVQVANRNVVRSSIGAGLTWASPFGALTVDYAVPLTKAAYDVVQPLRFSAGGF